MGNHWHLLLWPREDGDLSDFMRWITLTHTQRYHISHGTIGIGHLYRGLYKSFPVQDDRHYLTVLRYIESNPVRAGLVRDAGKWLWSSLAVRQGVEAAFELSDGPIELPANWAGLLRKNFSHRELGRIENSVKRGAPFGDDRWREMTAVKLKLKSTLRLKGRPKKCTGHL